MKNLSNLKLKPLIGNDYTDWKVLNFSHYKIYNGRKRFWWNCLCKCGTKKAVLQEALFSGLSTSCGCKKIVTNEEIKLELETSVEINEKGCWNWEKGTNPQGYGYCSFNGKSWSAHRLSYTIFKGEIPEGLVIRHQCQNPRCINPNHLLIGTHQDNASDSKRDRGIDMKRINKRFVFTLPDPIHESLRKQAINKNMTMSCYILQALIYNMKNERNDE